MKKIHISIALLNCYLLLFTLNASAQIYKWHDSSGQIHYTQRPPVHGTDTELLEEKVKLAARPLTPQQTNNFQGGLLPLMPQSLPSDEALAAKKTTHSENADNTEAKAEADKPQPDKAAEQASDKNNSATAAYCSGQINVLKMLIENKRIKWKENNQIVTLDEEQRLQKIEDIKNNINDQC